jgi:hypothetical protein
MSTAGRLRTAPGGRGAGRLRQVRLDLLRNHTIGVLTRRLIANLDRDRFEVMVFRGTWDEMAAAIGERRTGQRLSAALDVAQRESPRRAHILFYPDIGMMGLTYFLALRSSLLCSA